MLEISDTSLLIAHSVSKFVAMAMGVGQGEIQRKGREKRRPLHGRGKRRSNGRCQCCSSTVDAMTSMLL